MCASQGAGIPAGRPVQSAGGGHHAQGEPRPRDLSSPPLLRRSACCLMHCWASTAASDGAVYRDEWMRRLATSVMIVPSALGPLVPPYSFRVQYVFCSAAAWCANQRKSRSPRRTASSWVAWTCSSRQRSWQGGRTWSSPRPAACGCVSCSGSISVRRKETPAALWDQQHFFVKDIETTSQHAQHALSSEAAQAPSLVKEGCAPLRSRQLQVCGTCMNI